MAGRATPPAGTVSAPFGAVYETHKTPIAFGYDPALQLVIRANPTKAQWQEWMDASDTPAELTEGTDDQKAAHKAAYIERLCRSLCMFYHKAPETEPGFRFGTLQDAIEFWHDDSVPDELWAWILNLPWLVIAARRESLMGNFLPSSGHRNN